MSATDFEDYDLSDWDEITPEQVANIEAVLDLITKYPDKLDMGQWVSGVPRDLEEQGRAVIFDPLAEIKGLTVDACGTSCCLSGWAAIVSGLEFRYVRNVYGNLDLQVKGTLPDTSLDFPVWTSIEDWGDGSEDTFFETVASAVLGAETMSQREDTIYNFNLDREESHVFRRSHEAPDSDKADGKSPIKVLQEVVRRAKIRFAEQA